MEGTVIGLLINLERVFGNGEKNIVDKEKPDDNETRICLGGWV